MHQGIELPIKWLHGFRVRGGYFWWGKTEVENLVLLSLWARGFSGEQITNCCVWQGREWLAEVRVQETAWNLPPAWKYPTWNYLHFLCTIRPYIFSSTCNWTYSMYLRLFDFFSEIRDSAPPGKKVMLILNKTYLLTNCENSGSIGIRKMPCFRGQQTRTEVYI